MLAVFLNANHQTDDLIESLNLRRYEGGDSGRARSQRASLIEHNYVQRTGSFQSISTLNQDTASCRDTSSNHDRRRCCEAESARTSRNEDGDAKHHCKEGLVFVRRHPHGGERVHPPRDQPREKRYRGQNHNSGYKDVRNAIRKGLNRRLDELGVFDEMDNLVERRVCAHLFSTYDKGVSFVNCTTYHSCADFSRHRHRFSTHHGLVYECLASHDDAVGGHSRSRKNLQQITHVYELGRDDFLTKLSIVFRRPEQSRVARRELE